MSRITVVQDGVCLKSDKELIRSSLFSRTRQLERVIERQKHVLTELELKELIDEKDRTFALVERYNKY